MAVAATLEGILEACVALGESLDHELEAAATTASIVLAEAAKASHWFENQTSAAETNTVGIVPAGAWLAGTLAFGAEIGVEYGSYLEERSPVLGLAWNLTEDEIARTFDEAMKRAVESTPGWRSG